MSNRCWPSAQHTLRMGIWPCPRCNLSHLTLFALPSPRYDPWQTLHTRAGALGALFDAASCGECASCALPSALSTRDRHSGSAQTVWGYVSVPRYRSHSGYRLLRHDSGSTGDHKDTKPLVPGLASTMRCLLHNNKRAVFGPASSACYLPEEKPTGSLMGETLHITQSCPIFQASGAICCSGTTALRRALQAAPCRWDLTTSGTSIGNMIHVETNLLGQNPEVLSTYRSGYCLGKPYTRQPNLSV